MRESGRVLLLLHMAGERPGTVRAGQSRACERGAPAVYWHRGGAGNTRVHRRLLSHARRLPPKGTETLGRKAGRGKAGLGWAGEHRGARRVLKIRRRDARAERAQPTWDKAGREWRRRIIGKRLV